MNAPFLTPAMLVLADWSLRWGVVIALLALALAVRPPRRAATRLLLCQLVLVGGLLLPLVPRCWGPGLPAPEPESLTAEPAEPPLPAAGPVSPSQEILRENEANPRALALPGGLPADAPRGEALVPDTAAAVSAARSAGEWAALAGAAVWLAGVAVLAARLAAARVWLARFRRAARPAPAEAVELLNACRSEMAVRRRADLVVHTGVASPVLLGGWRPAVAVPPDWLDLPADTRRAALLHELTHLARRDDQAKAAEELVRALFWFHPLVRWLLRRLDAEREQVCDAAVVRQGVAPRQLARVLLEFARRQGPGRPTLGRLAVLPLFNRFTFTDRIHRLLEEDAMRRVTTLSPGRRAAIAAGVLGSLVALGGFGVRAGVAEDGPRPPADPPKPQAEAPKPDRPRAAVSGVVQDEQGRPVAGANLAAVIFPLKGGARPVTGRTGADGSFAFAGLPGDRPEGAIAYVLAGKEGFGPAGGYAMPSAPKPLTLTLPAAAAVDGTVRDREGRPVAGARVRLGTIQRIGNSTSWGYFLEEVVRGTPLEPLVVATSDARGAFRFPNAPAGRELIFYVNAPGFAELDAAAYGSPTGYVPKAGARPVALVLAPEARLKGRVVSHVPGVKTEGLAVWVRFPGGASPKRLTTDAAGRFSIGGLPEGDFLVQVEMPPADAGWTPRRALTVALRPGATSEAEIELIAGVLVEGKVIVGETAKPALGAYVVAHGPASPRPDGTNFRPQAVTDAEGRYRLRLPSGETDFSLAGVPKGYGLPPPAENQRRVVIPDGAKTFAGPAFAVQPAIALEGRVVDARGRPLAGARIVSLCRSVGCMRFGGQKILTDNDGRFRLEQAADGPFRPGEAASLEVELPGGQTYEVNTVVARGVAEVRVPVVVGAKLKGPEDVRPGELAGVVADEEGRPLEGVSVHIWEWVNVARNKARTDKDGVFRIKNPNRDRDDEKVEVRFRKEGYSPVLFTQQPLGAKGLVVVMDSKTYFEGKVTRTDGRPAAGALVRADQGPKQMQGGLVTNVWTETKAGEDGRYRLYVQPDAYAFEIKVPGGGVARLPKTAIAYGQARALDIRLQPGVTFRAVAVDATTGEPVPGVRLWSWQHKDVEGRSGADGGITIAEMLPGKFDFDVTASGYRRWWSDDAVSEWNRRRIDNPKLGWQRNFDNLDFDLKPGMAPVKIVLEKGVRFTGVVVQPDGKPVAGATVAPALTGTGNSLTGDTRFSVTTKADGTFEMLLPASGAAEYNLVAHDGKYQQWRKWANGVTPPIKTTPGQQVGGLVLALAQPATVRGRVVDASGKPVARREVRAHAADKLENRYYDPTTTTKEDGTFELRFIRPGQQYVQVAPFWLEAGQAPPPSTCILNLRGGETVEDVELVASDLPR